MITRQHALDVLGVDEDGDAYRHALAFREIRPTDLVLCAECRNVLTAVPHPYREDVHLVTECRGIPLHEHPACLAAHLIGHQRASDQARWAVEATERTSRRRGAAA